VENFYALHITETYKIWAIVVAESNRNMFKRTYARVIQLAVYRSVRGPRFGTAPGPALALMQLWVTHPQSTNMYEGRSVMKMTLSKGDLELQVR